MKTINGEAMLLGWAESHNGGVTIRLQLTDADALVAFKAMTVRKGKIAGQRLAYSFVEIGDDEQPVLEPELAKPKGGELAKWAGILCSDPLFAKWLEKNFTPLVARDPAGYIRLWCNVESRRELDHNALAGEKFRNQLLIPFNRWKEITV